MEDLIPPMLDPQLLSRALSKSKGDGIALGGFPPEFPADALLRAKTDILEFLNTAELVNLSTTGEGGWPVAHCMHFVCLSGSEYPPVIYMFTHHHTRKMANISADPRIAITVLQRDSMTRNPPAPFLSMRGIAHVVNDREQVDMAVRCNHNKVNYEFTKQMDLGRQPLLRADILNAVWQDVDREPGRVSYRRGFEA